MEINKKKKFLWVVSDFAQAGGQKYVYEISRELDKNKYEIDFLRVAPFAHEKDWSGEFFYEPTLLLGAKIYELSAILPVESLPVLKTVRLVKKISSYIQARVAGRNHNYLVRRNNKKQEEIKNILNDFLSEYDYIHVSGIAVFRAVFLSYCLDFSRTIVHVLSARFQDPAMYEGFDTGAHYNFVSGMREDSIREELKGFTDYRFADFPISFETIPFEVEKRNTYGKYKIAVFTRLSKMKPLDPYFYALKLLIEEGLDVELDIYGTGNPELLGLNRQLDYLYIRQYVNFKGHTEDIPATIKNTPPDLLWFQSSNSQPAGYAALEISMSGIPQIFWDFMYMGHKHPMRETFSSFTEITAFVTFTKQLLLSVDLRREIGIKQREYVLQHYSIKKNIHILEDFMNVSQ
jgi:glycosyltransferase involved in cell wall biosynthesis